MCLIPFDNFPARRPKSAAPFLRNKISESPTPNFNQHDVLSAHGASMSISRASQRAGPKSQPGRIAFTR
jgi:hypothetical protein